MINISILMFAFAGSTLMQAQATTDGYPMLRCSIPEFDFNLPVNSVFFMAVNVTMPVSAPLPTHTGTHAHAKQTTLKREGDAFSSEREAKGIMCGIPLMRRFVDCALFLTCFRFLLISMPQFRSRSHSWTPRKVRFLMTFICYFCVFCFVFFGGAFKQSQWPKATAIW